MPLLSRLKRLAKDLAPPIAQRAWQRWRPSPSDAEIFAADPFYRRHVEWNRGAAPNEIVLRPGLSLRLGPDSRYPHEHFCFRDAGMIEEFDAFLTVMQGKSRLLDVGALHGIFALAFTRGRPEARAVAVEPSPTAFAYLLYNLRANPDCAIRAAETALSDKEGSILMESIWQHLVAADPAAPARGPRFVIAARTGDQLCAEDSLAPDLIKIDIEGHELACLRGLVQTLRDHRPTLCLELHPGELRARGQSTGELEQFLRGLGYRFHRPDRTPCLEGEVAALEDIRRFLVQPDGVPL